MSYNDGLKQKEMFIMRKLLNLIFGEKTREGYERDLWEAKQFDYKLYSIEVAIKEIKESEGIQ
jgi:hypothetical protein